MIVGGALVAPDLSARVEKVYGDMEVILQIGAGPVGQFAKQAPLDPAQTGIAVWTPARVQQLFYGLKPVEALPVQSRSSPRARQRAIGRVRLNLEKLYHQGVRTLLVCDTDLITPWRETMAQRAIFPAIGHRLSRVMNAFDGCVSQIVINMQAQDTFWRTTLAQAIGGGMALPTPGTLAEISGNSRGWRDVICDIACAAPHADLCVVPAENEGRHPVPPLLARAGIDVVPRQDLMRRALADRGDAPDQVLEIDEHWQPFSAAQQAQMLEAYGEDLFWLTAGADGLARYVEEDRGVQDGKTRQRATMRGRGDDQPQGNMDENR